MTQPEDIPTGFDEVQRAKLEDPDFAVVRARAIARARGEVYNPERHGPFETPQKKRAKPAAEEAKRVHIEPAELLDRFEQRGPAQTALPISDMAERRRKDIHG